jgi:HK97 family phage portal protein
MVAPPISVGRAVPPGRSPNGNLIPPPWSTWPGGIGPYVWDATSARRVPAVARSVALYGGMVKQMPMDAYRAGQPLDRPNLLDDPVPEPVWNRARFVQVSVEDYLLSGNAISYVTARGADGWPLAVRYLPITWVYISWQPGNYGSVQYTYLGETLDPANVIHVARGVDRFYPIRGVGVVEEGLPTLDRVAMEEEYERSTLAGAAVPSVAIITPQTTLTQDVADEAKDNWMDKYGGPGRMPAILPNGTQIVPLAWSPSDTQLVEARKMSLTDVANLFNLDSYWLGAAVAGMTYKTAAPQYQQILRTSIEPVIADFEQVWSKAWLPRGQEVRFDRNKLLAEDLPTTIMSLVQAVAAGIMTPQTAWAVLLGEPLASLPPPPKAKPPAAVAVPGAAPALPPPAPPAAAPPADGESDEEDT